MTAEEIEKLRAARAAFRRKTAGSKFWVKRAKDGNRAERAAMLWNAAEEGLTRAEAATLIGCEDATLRLWMHKYLGSGKWPMGSEARQLLRELAGK